MSKQSLYDAFNITRKVNDFSNLSDYDIFPDKKLLDTLRTKIVENLIDKEMPKDKQFGFKKIQLGKLVVGDLTGIPVVMPDGTVKRVHVPDLPPNDPKDPNFKEYGVLFLDEITTVDEAQMQPALGLADSSRDMGEYKLPEHWLVVAAGNGPDCTNFMR